MVARGILGVLGGIVRHGGLRGPESANANKSSLVYVYLSECQAMPTEDAKPAPPLR